MDTSKRITKIIAEILEVSESEITMESGIGDFAKWDSLGHMNILREVEDEFEIEFEPEEIIEVENVGDIVELTEKKVKFETER